MDMMTRLNQLPTEVCRAFSENFIFLIYPDKVQHFPARNWTKQEFLTSLDERIGEGYRLAEWQNYVIALAKDEAVVAVIPRFQQVSELEK